MMTKVRESNFELMRIVSMFLIVLFHALAYSCYYAHAEGLYSYLLPWIRVFTLVHVNSFILITGYFQCEKKLRIRKVLGLVGLTWFYEVILYLVFNHFGIVLTPLTRQDILRTFLPLDYGVYWFIGNYIVLYIVSPILNKVIANSSKKELRNYIFILMLVTCFFSLVTQDTFYNNNLGRSLFTFVLLYFLGAYFKKYKVENSYFMKPFTKTARRTIYLVTLFLCSILGTMCFKVSEGLSQLNSIGQEMGIILNQLAESYASPIILLQTICYFLLFSTFSFRSKIVNVISSTTIGIYLIHENRFVRGIYKLTGISEITTIDSKAMLMLFLLVLGLFFVPMIIELIRKLIYNFIYKRKFCRKIRTRIKNYFANLGFNLNW